MGEGKSGVPEDRYESYRHVTDFNQSNFNGLKDMLDGADPEVLYSVAQHWQDVADALETHKKSFSKAVDKVMEHWQGESAERFHKRAQQIIANFEAGKPWCTHTARVMDESAKALQTAINKVRLKEESWDVGDLNDWGWSISDDELDEALKRGESASGLLEANKDDLDDEQTLRLESTIAMEQLGSSFVRASKALKAPEPGRVGRDDKIPDHEKDPSNDPGAINTPMIPSGGGAKGGGGGLKLPKRGANFGTTPKMPSSPSLKHPGVSGGLGELKPKGPSVGTGLDGLRDGPSGGGLKAPSGGPGGGGLHTPTGGGPGGGPGLSGMPGGMPGPGGLKSGGPGGLKGGAPGGLKGAGPGGPGGLKSGGPGGLKGGAPGTTSGGAHSGGRAGMPGMAGAHGGGAGKGAGGGGVSAGGAQARQKGGIIGSPGGKASSGGQGGAGLHRSRGGTASGDNSGSGRRPAGMMGGAHGAPGARGEGGGGDASRPDYLVEDEETWTAKRNVAPPVIE